MTTVKIMHPSRLEWTPPPQIATARSPSRRDHSSRSSSPRSPSASPRPRRVRPGYFFVAIGFYAFVFIVWCTFFQGGSGRGLAALFPRGYDEKLNRMLAMLTSRESSKRLESQAAADESVALSGFDCVGWRHTMDCDPNSDVLQSFNRSCDYHVRGGQAGYCAVKDRATGRDMRVMKLSCSTMRPDVLFMCSQALDFMQFRHETEAAIASARTAKPAAIASASTAGAPEDTNRGILMVVYPKLLVSTYAVVRTLRESLNCSLPIEIWFLETEMGGNATGNVVLQALVSNFAPLSLVAVTDPDVTGFNSKVHAILNTNVTEVLFLDADNIPVRDPTYLFEGPEYRRTGALFWPDFWHPAHSIFNINNQSLLWELLDLDFVDMFEQESGQLLIDKRKSFVPLQALKLFAFHRPSIFDSFKLAWGDKDLFRLAWLKSNSGFHMIERPPAVAGSIVQSKFCGMSMAQFDPAGEIVFLHRNAMKLNGGRPSLGKEPDTEVWTHLQTFAWRSNVSAPTNATIDAAAVSALAASAVTNRTAAYELLKEFYRVTIYNGAPEFPPSQWCYGQPSPQLEANWRTVPWSETPFVGVEREVLRFASEGAALLPAENVIMVSS